MKLTIAVAALLNCSVNGVKLSSNDSWDKSSLPACPSDARRTVMDDGLTHITKYPYNGATCAMQLPSTGELVFVNENTMGDNLPLNAPALPNFEVKKLEHCPDFNERFTLVNGTTKAVPYPVKGYNCQGGWALVQEPKVVEDPTAKLEECPNDEDDNSDFLKDGKTLPVGYPKLGYNCRVVESLAQVNGDNLPHNAPALPNFDVKTLERCPDFNERFTLVNGTTKAVAYPNKGYNCQGGWALVQEPKVVEDPTAKLELCPNDEDDNSDFLKDGKTKPVAYPVDGYNCRISESLAQVNGDNLPNNAPPLPNFDVKTLERCPDFNERFTLVNGTTKAVAYPNKGYNCQHGWALAQGDNLPNNAPALPNFDVKTLERCPDFNERFTLVNGTTKAVAYPNKGYNCQHGWGLVQGDNLPNNAPGLPNF